jgi:hypothetical protein
MQEREREREREIEREKFEWTRRQKTIIHVPFFSCLTSHLLPLPKTTVNTHSSHYNNIFLLSTVRTNLLYQQSCISFTRNHLHRDKHHWERERERTMIAVDLFFYVFGWNDNVTIFLSNDLATPNQQVINMT